uniref:Uncharacterized protein n=1 Tax=Strix occidentalis caurina TaxID=311401 RepID=A0A8D0FMH0_STROC
MARVAVRAPPLRGGAGGARRGRLTVPISNAPARAARGAAARCPRPRGGAAEQKARGRAGGGPLAAARWLDALARAGPGPVPPLLSARAEGASHHRPPQRGSIGRPARLSPADPGPSADARRRSRPLISRRARRSRPEPRP